MPNAQRFWVLRSTGRLGEAKALYQEMAAAGETSLDLMRISLLRAEEGAEKAEAEVHRLESVLIPSFQLFSQKALNAFALGRYAESLENLLAAEKFPASPWEDLTLLTTRLICLDSMAFPLKNTLAEIEQKLGASPVDDAEQIRALLKAVNAREFFREGNFPGMLALVEEDSWSQLDSFVAWVAALPYAKLQDTRVEKGLERLTRDTDFYLRNYRLQTLVGRVQESPREIPTSWRDRADRLYLWTWRWLKTPSSSHAQSLSAVLREFEQWDGKDVLTAEDARLIRNALAWILVFEPRYRARWQALLRRISAAPGEEPPLFAYEQLWLERTRAHLAKNEQASRDAEIAVAAHPLHGHGWLGFGSVLAPYFAEGSVSNGGIRVDPETGEIFRGEERLLISLPLAQLLALLAASGKASFADALKVSFGLAKYQPELHDAKIQNLLARARKLLDREIVSRNRWIFLEYAGSLINFASNLSRPRLMLPPSDAAPSPRDRVRNERSLSLLLKEAGSLRGREISRAELESALSIPKATINRYLRAWMARGWITRSGAGRQVRYRITFFES